MSKICFVKFKTHQDSMITALLSSAKPGDRMEVVYQIWRSPRYQASLWTSVPDITYFRIARGC